MKTAGERIERWFYAALVAVVVFFSWFVFAPYVGALVLSGTLALIFYPVYRGLQRGVRSEMAAAFLTVLFAALIVFIPLIFFGIQLFGETTALYGKIAMHGNTDLGPMIARYLRAIFPNAQISVPSVNVGGLAQQILGWLSGNLGNLFSSVAQIFFLAFLSLMGLYYFLKDGKRLEKWLLDFAPLSPEYTERVVSETESALGSVVGGTLVMAVLMGVIIGGGFFFFGIPNAAFWGALTIVAALIPIIGPWLVAVPGIAYLVLTGHGAAAIGLGVWSVAFVNLVGVILAPQFMHRKLDIHPFIILLSVIGGISAFGPIGFLIGPFVIALLFSLLRIYPEVILGTKDG